MWLGMKNLNMGVLWKIQFSEGKGGGNKKPIYRGELHKKGALTIYRFKGVLLPQCTLCALELDAKIDKTKINVEVKDNSMTK